MSASPCRRFVAAATAMLFVLGIVGHGLVAARMAGEPGMAKSAASTAASTDMAMHNGDMDCSDTDCSGDTGMHMACFAHCAAPTGIVSEPASLPMALVARTVPLAPALPLASVHGPPDPYPPKPILI